MTLKFLFLTSFAEVIENSEETHFMRVEQSVKPECLRVVRAPGG